MGFSWGINLDIKALKRFLTDGADGEFSDDQMPRLPPVGPPSWDSNVVCIQPARNLSRPDGLEEPEEPQSTVSSLGLPQR